MKKFLAFLLVLIIVAGLLCSCSNREYFMLVDGEDYKNPSLELEYVSFDTVRVTFAVDLYTFHGEVKAHIVLLSENSVIGTCELTVRYDDENERVTAAQDVKLTYHNSGAITGYVDHLSGTFFE